MKFCGVDFRTVNLQEVLMYIIVTPVLTNPLIRLFVVLIEYII